MSKRFGVLTQRVTHSGNTIFVVIETSCTNHTVSVSGFPGTLASMFKGVLMSDEIGDEFPLSLTAQIGKSSNVVVEVFAAPLVSHAATQLNLRVWQFEHLGMSNAVCAFVLHNPASRAGSGWNPPPLPM